MDYKYKNVCKNVFIDRFKQSDIMEDYKNFLKKIEKLKPYMIEFEEKSIMKIKIYLFDYIIYSNDHCLIIIIYDMYIFFANNRI